MRAPAWLAAASFTRSCRRCTVGVLVCLVVPLASWVVDGRGRFAFTMYASMVTYRLDIDALDDGGLRHALDPGEVAENVSSPAAPFVAGAGEYRTVAQIDALRDHLRDVARAACRDRHATTIEITLHERPWPPGSEAGSGTTHTSERVTCLGSE
jgi:hypothetical protein